MRVYTDKSTIAQYTTEVSETKEIISLGSNAVNGNLSATLKGNTVVNLLSDNVAGCESTADWGLSTATLATDNANEFEGTNCFKLTLSSTSGSAARDILPFLNTSKYYFVSAYLKNSNLATFLIFLNCVGDAGLIVSSSQINTNYARVGIVLQPSNFDGASSVLLSLYGEGSVGNFGFIDALMLQEISASEYLLGATVLLQQKSYHRGTKSTNKSRLKSVDSGGLNPTLATCPIELHSVSAISDEWNCNTGEITKNVELDSDVSGTQYDSIDTATYTNVDVVKTTAFTLAKAGTTDVDGMVRVISSSGRQLSEVAQADIDNTTSIGKFYYHTDKSVWFIVANGAYADIATARTGLGTTQMYYQLANPTTTYIPSAILTAHPNGTVYNEPYVAESDTAQFYSTGLVLDSAYPLASLDDIDEINKYDLETGVVTPIAISSLTLASSTSITISGALASDFYAISYNYNNLSTIGTVEYSYATNTIGQIKDLVENAENLDEAIKILLLRIKALELEVDNMFQEQSDVAINVTAITDGVNILHFNASDTRYMLRNLTVKSADPGANTVTITLYGLVNDVLTAIDTFAITTANYTTHFKLIDMFGLDEFAGDEIKITATTDAGSYAITGQYNYALSRG
jgi:hypothetical protein